MPPRSLRSQLNQIRAWVRQGRTDAWIAHQLEVSASELQDFRRQHGLSPDDDDAAVGEVDLRDEIEAEIEAATVEEPDEQEGGEEPDGSEAEGRPRRRRRRGRRGGRGRRGRRTLAATFDHGEDGVELRLDSAVTDNRNYAEHWAGHRDVTVTIEPEQIVVRRTRSGPNSAGDPDSNDSGTDGDPDSNDSGTDGDPDSNDSGTDGDPDSEAENDD